MQDSVSTSVSLRANPKNLLAWRPFVAELALVLLVFAMLWPTTLSLVAEWTNTGDTTYPHGFLVVGVSLWLLWRDRSALLDRERGSLAAVGCIAVFSVVWLISVRAAIKTGHQVLLPLTIWLMIAAVFGLRPARRHAFAVAYLVFAVPVWGSLTGELQSLTTTICSLLLSATGVPAYVENNIVHLAVGAFEIAGGCSGLHFLIVGLALGSLYGELNDDSIINRLKLLLLAVLFSLATNWIRVYAIILAGYQTNMQHYLVRVSHNEFGWAVFAVMFAIYFWIARQLPVAARKRGFESKHATDAPQTIGRSGYAALAALSLGPAWNLLMPVRAADLSADTFTFVPAGWIAREPELASWRPIFHGADRQHLAQFVSANSSVLVFIAEYALQYQGRELINSENKLLGSDPSWIVSSRQINEAGRATEWEVRTDGAHYLLWQYYEVSSRRLTGSLDSQIWYALYTLLAPTPSRIVAVRAECDVDCGRARATLTQFAKNWHPNS